jgi:S1-C subfamily serine protease
MVFVPNFLAVRRTGFAWIVCCATAVLAVYPNQSAVAQVRALPDFTDLVDQVGPAVVNIRTLLNENQCPIPTSSLDKKNIHNS